MQNQFGQIPFLLPVDVAKSRDDLIESSANKLAVELLDNWPDWPSNMVILAGPTGSGKSHLAEIWAQNAGAKIVNVSDLDHCAEELASSSLVLEGAGLGNIPETELFHLINRMKTSGNFLLITSREFPSSWQIKLADLASRLKLAHLVELKEPDDALLAGTIVKLFADRQIEIAANLVEYLVTRMERSLGVAGSLVEWVDREAMARKTKINRKLLAEALAAFEAKNSHI